MIKMFRKLGAAAFALFLLASPSHADQSSACVPTTGVFSGLTAAGYINGGFDALISSNSGSSAPANSCDTVAVNGQWWMDTTTNTLKIHNGTTWVVVGKADTSTGIWNAPVGGGSTTLASGTTTDLGSLAQSHISVTGTTTITSFGSSAPTGQMKFLTFAGALTITYNATSMILPSAANITTAAGDAALAMHLGSGNWRVVAYTRIDGAAITQPTIAANRILGNNSGSTGQPSALTPTQTTAMLDLSTTSVKGLAPVLSNSPFDYLNGSGAYALPKPNNIGLTASVGSNILTVTLTGANGSAPSATNPVQIPFRDTTLTSGAPVWVSATAATSITTFATGATLGSANSTAFRFWVVAFNNSGTIVLGLVNCSTSAGVSSILNNESALLSSTSMTGSATSAGVIYTPNGTTVTTKAFKILGYVEYDSAGLTTAGTYASAPDIVQLFGAGVKKPGDIIQTSYVQNGTLASTVSTYSNSATLPTTGAGISAASTSVTPTSAANRLRVSGQAILGSSTNSTAFVSYLYNGTTVVAVSGAYVGLNSSVVAVAAPIYYEVNPNTASSITYTVYGAGHQATVYLNGAGATQYWGSVANSFIRVEEIMN